MFKLILNSILKDTNKGVIIVDSKSQIEFVSDRVKEYLGLEDDAVGVGLAKIELGGLFVDLLRGQGSLSSLDKYESQNYTVDFDSDFTYISPKSSNNVYKIEVFTEDTSSGEKAIIMEKDVEPDYQRLLELNSDLIAFIYSLDNVELRYADNRDILSKDLLNKVHYKDLETLRDAIRSVYNEDVKSFSVPCRVQINNKWRVYKLSIQSESILKNLSYSIITGNDITDQYLSEQRRLVINRILRHDIRNDMNVIKGYAEILAEEDKNGPAEKITKKSDKLIRLTNEIREIDQNLYRVDHRIKRININTMLRNKVKQMQEKYSDISVRLDLCSEDKVIANQLIESAIRHVLKNGVIHNTNENRELYISSTYEEQQNLVSIIIEDNGPGIDMSVKKIIESGVETPLKHTTGLGLWIVKWIIELVDGQLSITNRKETSGTQVHIKLHHDSADIEEIRSKNKLKQSDFDSLPGFSESDSSIRTTTRVVNS